MIWQAPWAFVGLAALVLPILIHRLSRRIARSRRFPTLRFIGETKLNPTRRTRITDWALLLVRLGILAAAVIALAQPLVLTPGRKQAVDRAMVRAIIVDSSASMYRAAGGQRAVDSAMATAHRMVADAPASVVLETGDPGGAVAGAVQWLESRPGGREVVIISDFQLGAIDSTSLMQVPRDIGIHLVRIGGSSGDVVDAVSASARGDVVAHVTEAPIVTTVAWSSRPAKDSRLNSDSSVSVAAGAADMAGASAAARAAAATDWTPAHLVDQPLTGPADQRILVVFPGAPRFAELSSGARPIDIGWMARAVISMRNDDEFGSAAAAAAPTSAAADTSRFVVVARNDSGRPVAVGAAVHDGSHDRLLILPLVGAGSLASAALIGAAQRANETAYAAAELEPASISDAILHRWERPPGSFARALAANGGPSDGRWLWVAALVLLGAESLLRRPSRMQVDVAAS